jgi:NAD-dependent deacetylase
MAVDECAMSAERQAKDAKLGVEQAREILRRATETSSKAKQAREDAKIAVETMRKTVSTLEGSVKSAEKAVELKSSFDDQWKKFQDMFDNMNKLALERIGGMLGGGAAAGTRPGELITEARVAQVLRRAKKVVVLTGAGVSAESGIPTFRGADGYWTVGSKNYRPQELVTWEKFNEHPDELWRWYQYRWGICTKAKPNPGHHALVELEKLVDGEMLLVTQNIDGLHLQAGSDPSILCEIHGRIDEMRCDERVEGACLHGINLNDPEQFKKARATVVKTPRPAKDEKNEHLCKCKTCGVRQRPKILWFDESYNEAFYKYHTVAKKTDECDVLLIIGTQLCTGGPSMMVQKARSSGAIIIKIDPIVDLNDDGSKGMLHLQAKSGDCLPRIMAELKLLRKEPYLAPLASSSIVRPVSLVQTPTKSKSPPHTPPLPSEAGKRNSISPPDTPPLASEAIKRSLGKPGTPPLASSVGMRNSAKPQSLRASSTPAARRSIQGGNASKGSSLKAAASISLAKGNETCNALGPSLTRKTPSPLEALQPAVIGAPVGFFVYGTLRPDDDSGAAWTKKFQEGLEGEAALLPGASLYIDGSYPAVCLEDTRCSVRGVILTPTGNDAASILASKLQEADQIEGYPDLYHRTVVEVHTASGQLKKAYLYHKTGRTDRESCARVADGDWMSRKSAQKPEAHGNTSA